MGKAVVTGGAGFIGSHIVDGLVTAGHEVTIIDDLSSGKRENIHPEASLLELDITSPEARSVLTELAPEILIHAAAQISVRVSMEDPPFDGKVNIVGLLNLLHGLREERMPYLVFLSTGGALYGEQDEFPASEDHPIRPTSVYGMSKYASELYLDLWRREKGLSFAALRLGNVYGPRQNPHGEAGVVAIFTEKLLRGELPIINGTGEQTRDYVFVGDVVNAVTSVVGERVEGSFNIGTGKETSVNQLFESLIAHFPEKVSPRYGEARPGEQVRSVISSDRASERFGWRPECSLDDGLAATYKWFQERA